MNKNNGTESKQPKRISAPKKIYKIIIIKFHRERKQIGSGETWCRWLRRRRRSLPRCLRRRNVRRLRRLHCSFSSLFQLKQQNSHTHTHRAIRCSVKIGMRLEREKKMKIWDLRRKMREKRERSIAFVLGEMWRLGSRSCERLSCELEPLTLLPIY